MKNQSILAFLIISWPLSTPPIKRPIMTITMAISTRVKPAFSFILGVFPLVIASGSGAESRKVMGMALLGGMSIATFLGVFMYPMLFVFIGKIAGYEKKRKRQEELVEVESE